MEKLTEVLSMGGYAGFVWPAYGVALGAMALMLVATLKGLRKAQADLKTLRALPEADEA
ncbi:MAG: heme exporter protein CcmD [Rickettsiales bacterium]|nr:heme exporter protein CcmD [Rickettsiales bacterium]